MYTSTNHTKYYLKVHIILVTKYRKRILSKYFGDRLIEIIKMIADKSDFSIDIIEKDKDHIHMLISYPPKLSIASIVNRLKSISTIEAYNEFENFLSRIYFKKHMLWSSGYFACSIGEASTDTIYNYIKNQG